MTAAVEKKTSLVVLGFEEFMIRELTELFKRAYDENPAMSSFSFSEGRVQDMIGHAILNPEKVGGFACIDMEKRRIIGALVAAKSGVPFSDEPIVSDVLSYITKEHRDGAVLNQLLVAYEGWAKRIGVKKIFFVSSPMNGDHGLIAGWIPLGSRMMRAA